MATSLKTSRASRQAVEENRTQNGGSRRLPDALPISAGEAILRHGKREITILVASEQVTITHARYAAGERVAAPHIHHQHTDSFYVLEGELTFVIGAEAETVTVSSGGFVAAPPGVAHSVRNDSDRSARWLTIHAHDGGFAAFMRGIRDGAEVEWDIASVPADGGLPASEAIVRPNAGEMPTSHSGAAPHSTAAFAY